MMRERNGLWNKGTLVFTGIILSLTALFPLFVKSEYLLHIGILILIWSFIATSWAMMGRFGLVSLGHGVFMGIGAYTAGILFNKFGLIPWVGLGAGIFVSLAVASITGYACFRFGVLGDYFALITLALVEIFALLIEVLRDFTEGSLGMTIKAPGDMNSFLSMQFGSKIPAYYLALAFFIFGLVVWILIEKSKLRDALKAIEDDEVASRCVGINVTKYKMIVTNISAVLTTMGGFYYGFYIGYINPRTVSGVELSLQIAFMAILGGMNYLMGPFVGTTIMISLQEYLRVMYGTKISGLSEVVYGVLLIVIIISMPQGIWGVFERLFSSRKRDVDPEDLEGDPELVSEK